MSLKQLATRHETQLSVEAKARKAAEEKEAKTAYQARIERGEINPLFDFDAPELDNMDRGVFEGGDHV